MAHLADRQLPTTTHPFRPVLDKYCVMGRLDKTSSGVSCVFCSCVGDVSSNRDVRNDMELRFSSSRKLVFFTPSISTITIKINYVERGEGEHTFHKTALSLHTRPQRSSNARQNDWNKVVLKTKC